MTSEQIIDEILEKEGGYVNNPIDPGGPTNHGITLATLTKWRGKVVTAEDIQALTQAEAREIYKTNYINIPGFDKLPESVLKSNLIDFGVNSGPKTAIMNLQALLGVKADGILGPKTLSCITGENLRLLNNELVKRRVLTYGRIVQSRPKKVIFLYGWLKRALSFFEDGDN